jgi:alkyl hydroperoxide reductase subunit F
MQRSEAATVLYDTIIIGAGPAGLSAAIYTIRKLMKTLIISTDLGGQLAWTSDVENYLGFSHVNGPDLIRKFENHVEKFGVERLLADVTMVDMAGRIKSVTTSKGTSYYGKTLIIATGGRHRPLNIPGERELTGRGVSYCSTCDAPLYADVDVAVIGGGNSGMGAVLDLINIASKAYLISMTPLTGDPVYHGKILQSSKVRIMTEYQPIRILGEQAVQAIEIKSLQTGDVETLPVEGVFVEIGILPNSSLFIDTLATNPKGEILVDSECRTGLAGVFACGDVTNVPFKQVVVAVGEGSKAALSAYDYLLSQK